MMLIKYLHFLVGLALLEFRYLLHLHSGEDIRSKN